jgi:hypothetical protein
MSAYRLRLEKIVALIIRICIEIPPLRQHLDVVLECALEASHHTSRCAAMFLDAQNLHLIVIRCITMHSGQVPDMQCFDVGSPRKKRGCDARWARGDCCGCEWSPTTWGSTD